MSTRTQIFRPRHESWFGDSVKDYEHVVVWLDYFDRNLSRSQGRRLKRDVCVSGPRIDDLVEAAKIAGFEVTETNDRARHPRRAHQRSGYVAIPKTAPKSRVLYRIAPKLARLVRNR